MNDPDCDCGACCTQCGHTPDCHSLTTQETPVTNPEDILPAAITRMIFKEAMPRDLAKTVARDHMAGVVAFLYPAIEAHIREQVAQEIEQDFTASPWHLPPKPRIGAGNQWIDSRDCTKAAAIARRTQSA